MMTYRLLLVLAISGLSTLIPSALFAAVLNLTPVDTATPNVQSHSFEIQTSNCISSDLVRDGLEDETHYVFTPNTPALVEHVIIFFHGNGNYDFNDLCTGNNSDPTRAEVLGACHAIATSQNVAIIAPKRPASLSTSGRWFRDASDTEVSCLVEELTGVLPQVGVTPQVSITYSGWSGGGGTVSNIAPHLPTSNVAIFDGCYGNSVPGGWCTNIFENSNISHAYFYYDEASPGSSTGVPATLAGQQLCDYRRDQLDLDLTYGTTEPDDINVESCRSREVIKNNPTRSTGILVSKSHSRIPATCILDFLTGTATERCGGAGTLDQGAGGTPVPPTSGGGRTLSIQEVQPSPLTAPRLGVNIPGLVFSDLAANSETFTHTDVSGDTYSSIPFIGEYVAAVYRYLIAIIGIIAAVVIIVSGIQWMTSAGGEGIAAAKSRILSAIVGLMLATSSYLILFTINPDLVRLQNIQLFTIRGERITGDSAAVDSYSTFQQQLVNNPNTTISSLLSTITEATWDINSFDCNNLPAPAGVIDPSYTTTYTCPVGFSGASITTVAQMKEPLCRAGVLADAAGYVIHVKNPNMSSYRPFVEQAELWCESERPISNRRTYIALPGYSNHGHGVAIDVSLHRKPTGGETEGEVLVNSGEGRGQCNFEDAFVRDLARFFYEADPNFVRYESEVWHFEYGTAGLRSRDQYISRPASICSNQNVLYTP